MFSSFGISTEIASLVGRMLVIGGLVCEKSKKWSEILVSATVRVWIFCALFTLLLDHFLGFKMFMLPTFLPHKVAVLLCLLLLCENVQLLCLRFVMIPCV